MKPGDLVKRNDWGTWMKCQGLPPPELKFGMLGIVVEPDAESFKKSWFWVLWQDGSIEKMCNGWVEKIDDV